MAKKFLFATTFILIAIIIGVSGYLYFAKQRPALAQAANYHYIRPNGGNYGLENGSDWNNAFDGIPATLVRGDTYYIAGGNYTNQVKFNTPTSGALYIYIKKASVAANSGVAGWDNSFETTQAVFTGDLNYNKAWLFGSDYWDIDGITGSGTSGYGIKVTYATLAPTTQVTFLISVGYSYINLSHIDIAGQGSAYNETQVGISSGITDSYNNINHSYIHDLGNFIRLNRPQNHDWVLDHNYFKNEWSSSLHHGEALNLQCTDNLTVSYNIFENFAYGTGGIIQHSKATENCIATNWKIYGNIFLNSGNGGNGVIGVGNSTCGGSVDGIYVYNNSFINSAPKPFFFPLRTDPTPGCENTIPSLSNAFIYNNLIYNGQGCIVTMGQSSCNATNATVDYNYYNTATNIPTQAHGVISTESTSALFQNYTGGDYRLTSGSQAVDAGTDLGSPYDIDFNGVVRHQGAAWDIGAYEYISIPPPPLLTGDFNNDSKVNDLDFTTFKNALKSLFNSLFDLNSDSAIDVKDLGVLMSSWLP